MNTAKLSLGLVFLTFGVFIVCFGFPSNEVVHTVKIPEMKQKSIVSDCFLKIKVDKSCTEVRQLEVLIDDKFTDTSVFIGGDQHEFKCLPVPCSMGRISGNVMIIGNEIKSNPEQLKNALVPNDFEKCEEPSNKHHFEVQCGAEIEAGLQEQKFVHLNSHFPEEFETETTEQERSLMPAADAQWQNGWDSHLRVECPNRQGMVRVRSIHDNRREDRLWQWDCAVRTTTAFSKVHWTGIVNWWDQPLFFMCPANEFICGAESWHDNGREDRRWRFKCCKSDNHYTRNCALTGYVNGFDTPMDFNINHGSKVITGAFSFHQDRQEDRRWRFNFCDYKFCTPL